MSSTLLGELFVKHGPPEPIYSDSGPEFIATVLREWLKKLEVRVLYIEIGNPPNLGTSAGS
jgi:hypothetical protein